MFVVVAIKNKAYVVIGPFASEESAWQYVFEWGWKSYDAQVVVMSRPSVG